MREEIRELYQEVIIDHNRQPRNYHVMPDADKHAEGNNPLCGDQLTVYLKVQDGRISAVSFEGKGCAISTASASLMTDCLVGKTEQEAQALFTKVHSMLTGQDDNCADQLGKLAVLAGVRAFPARVKCATLAWHTLRAAIADDQDIVCTE